jgi:hypothetical protein
MDFHGMLSKTEQFPCQRTVKVLSGTSRDVLIRTTSSRASQRSLAWNPFYLSSYSPH